MRGRARGEGEWEEIHFFLMHCLFGNHCEGIQLIYTAMGEEEERGVVWCWGGVGGQDRDARPTIEGTIKRNEKARNHAKVKGGSYFSTTTTREERTKCNSYEERKTTGRA